MTEDEIIEWEAQKFWVEVQGSKEILEFHAWTDSWCWV